MNRRGFLYSLGSAVMAVAMDVLPKFDRAEPRKQVEFKREINLVWTTPEDYNYGQIIRSPFGLSGR